MTSECDSTSTASFQTSSSIWLTASWLVLMEAVSSHGPVDGKRHMELAKLFAGCTAGIVYVSCFPSRAVMRRYLSDISWETEVWCAEDPTHLIHFNGERFLAPDEPSPTARVTVCGT